MPPEPEAPSPPEPEPSSPPVSSSPGSSSYISNIYIYICIYMHVYIYVCVCVCVCVCVYACIYMYVCIYIYIYVCMYVYIYIHIYIYIYIIYIYTWWVVVEEAPLAGRLDIIGAQRFCKEHVRRTVKGAPLRPLPLLPCQPQQQVSKQGGSRNRLPLSVSGSGEPRHAP
jgi:hypothetical protein